MIATDNYCIKPGYESNPSGNLTLDANGRHYWTERRIRTSAYFQYSVYQRAAKIACDQRLQSAIDVGCGPAIKLMRLLSPVCHRVAGVDQQSAIDISRARYPSGEFYAENFEAPAADLRGEFDLIVCADVIEHMADPDTLIRYLFQVARDGAYLVISTPERDILRGPDSTSCPKTEHVREWNRGEFARFLQTRGLAILEHRLVPEMAFNLSRDYWDGFLAALNRRSFSVCQMAVCRVWNDRHVGVNDNSHQA